MELSTNFIVILIISIVVFGFGLYFITNLGETGEASLKTITQQSENQMKSLLDSGEQIIVYPEQLEIKRNSYGVYGVGIRNTLREPSVKFKIGVECSAFVTKSGVYNDNCNVGSADYDEWTYAPEEFPVKTVLRNENENIAIPIQPKGTSTPGTYIFNVYVCRLVNPNGDQTGLCSKSPDDNLKLFPEAGGFLKFRVVVP